MCLLNTQNQSCVYQDKELKKKSDGHIARLTSTVNMCADCTVKQHSVLPCCSLGIYSFSSLSYCKKRLYPPQGVLWFTFFQILGYRTN